MIIYQLVFGTLEHCRTNINIKEAKLFLYNRLADVPEQQNFIRKMFNKNLVSDVLSKDTGADLRQITD